MRIHEGNFAYEVVQNRDPQTQIAKSWDFIIFALHPLEKVIERGSCSTKEKAEDEARRYISSLSGKNAAA